MGRAPEDHPPPFLADSLFPCIIRSPPGWVHFTPSKALINPAKSVEPHYCLFPIYNASLFGFDYSRDIPAWRMDRGWCPTVEGGCKFHGKWLGGPKCFNAEKVPQKPTTLKQYLNPTSVPEKYPQSSILYPILLPSILRVFQHSW